MYGHDIQQSIGRPGKVANPARGQLNWELRVSLSPFVLRIWFREVGLAVPSRVSLLILHIQAESGAYSRIPLDFRGGVHTNMYGHHI